MKDESLLSPVRLWYAALLWVWLRRDGRHISLARLLRYHRRPLHATKWECVERDATTAAE